MFASGLFDGLSEQVGMAIIMIAILIAMIPKDTKEKAGKFGIAMLLRWFFGR